MPSMRLARRQWPMAIHVAGGDQPESPRTPRSAIVSARGGAVVPRGASRVFSRPIPLKGVRERASGAHAKKFFENRICCLGQEFRTRTPRIREGCVPVFAKRRHSDYVGPRVRSHLPGVRVVDKQPVRKRIGIGRTSTAAISSHAPRLVPGHDANSYGTWGSGRATIRTLSDECKPVQLTPSAMPLIVGSWIHAAGRGMGN